MFFFLILSSALSLICPDGVKYFHDQDFNVTIQKNKWYYFYTTLNKNEQFPSLMLSVKSDFPINLYIEELPRCPDGSKPPFLESPGGPIFIDGSTNFKSRQSMISIGIFSNEAGNVSVSLKGQHFTREPKYTSLKLLLVLFLMIAITGYFFCNVILPNEMNKDKVKEE